MGPMGIMGMMQGMGQNQNQTESKKNEKALELIEEGQENAKEIREKISSQGKEFQSQIGKNYKPSENPYESKESTEESSSLFNSDLIESAFKSEDFQTNQNELQSFFENIKASELSTQSMTAGLIEKIPNLPERQQRSRTQFSKPFQSLPNSPVGNNSSSGDMSGNEITNETPEIILPNEPISAKPTNLEVLKKTKPVASSQTGFDTFLSNQRFRNESQPTPQKKEIPASVGHSHGPGTSAHQHAFGAAPKAYRTEGLRTE